jgi:hypothetical protein
MGPSLCCSRTMILLSLSSCTASTAAVGSRGFNGGATGSTSSTRFFRSMPSAIFGGRCTSDRSPSKYASRCWPSGRAPIVATVRDLSASGCCVFGGGPSNYHTQRPDIRNPSCVPYCPEYVYERILLVHVYSGGLFRSARNFFPHFDIRLG